MYRVLALCPTVLGLTILIAACESPSPAPGPSRLPAPTPLPSSTPPSSTFSLTGQVFDVTPSGRFPVADVEVFATVLPPGGGSFTNAFTTTGADGRYSFSELPRGSAVLNAFSPGRRQVCGALPALTANTQQDLEVTSIANPQRSPSPTPVRVTGQIYEMTPSGRVGLGGAVIHVWWLPDGYFLTVVADADGYYLACGIPANRTMTFEVARDISAGYNGEYDIPYFHFQFDADAMRDFELKRAQ